MRRLLTFMLAAATLLTAAATDFENRFVGITTPDDSWETVNVAGALGRMGERMMVSRSDSHHAAIDLARIDFVEMPFTPESYIDTQVVGRRDVFCHNADTVGVPTDTTLLGRPARTVTFTKQANGYTYLCDATAANIGFGTLFVITGRRQGMPNVVSRVVNSIRVKTDTTTLAGTPALVAAAGRVLKRHPIVSAGIDTFRDIDMPDPQTVRFTVTVPYLTRDAIDVPMFIQTKRAEWLKARQDATLTDLMLATAMRERKDLRYVFVDDHGNELGTLLILPEEYGQ